MGSKDYQRCVSGGYLRMGISVDNVLVFAVPLCTPGTGVCPDRRRARRTASALLEVAMHSAFQAKCSHNMAVRGLLEGGSVMMRRMKPFAVENEMVRGRVSLAVAAAFITSLLTWHALMTWNTGGVFPAVLSLANRLGVMCATLNSF